MVISKNDVISWLMDGARAAKEPITLSDISSRILLVSFGAIHTSSAVSVYAGETCNMTRILIYSFLSVKTFTAALFQLCLSPENAKELREEIESVIKEDGWTKDALSKMHKLDSYFRESQRVHFLSTRESFSKV